MSKKVTRVNNIKVEPLAPIPSRKRKHITLSYETSSTPSSSTDKKPKIEKGEEPPHWREVYALIKQMRTETPAPVDTMGCAELSDDSAPPAVRRYHSLISLMLSSQTKDQVTYMAMNKLKSHGLTVENIRQTEVSKLQELIYPVSFYLRKAQYIKEATETLYEKYNSDIPPTVEELMKLKGVGPKMAYLCMTCAWGKVEGIGVDVHVHRICNRLGWVSTSSPEATRKSLEEWLPHEYWDDINTMLVGFGQTICKPIGPKCGVCKVASLCPSASLSEIKKTREKKSKKLRKSEGYEEDDEDDDESEVVYDDREDDDDDEADFIPPRRSKRSTLNRKKTL